MKKIKKIKLTKKFGTQHHYFVSGIIPNEFSGIDMECYGYHIQGSSRMIDLRETPTNTNDVIDFTTNMDEPYQTFAKSHGVYRYGELLGKVSIRDGNYPPPYTQAVSNLLGYDQNELCALFEITEMEITLAANNLYTMNLTLKKGDGGTTVQTSSHLKIDVIATLDGIDYIAILVGIEDSNESNQTVKFSASGLNLTREIGIVPVRFANNAYDLMISNPYLFKKGVIELH